MSEQKNTDEAANQQWNGVLLFFAGGVMAMVLIMAGFDLFVSYYFKDDFTKRGQFGDQFGALNALFSGLAFLGLILTLTLQGRDLRTQTKALNLQIKEFNDQKLELERAAKAQEESNTLTKIMLLVEIRKMKASTMIKKAEFSTTSSDRSANLKIAANFVSITADEVDEKLKAAGMS